MQDLLGRLSSPEVGGTPVGGVSRPALSNFDRLVRLRFHEMMVERGLETRHDDLGSMYGRREGLDPSLAPVLVGSHLDTVVPGGKFDGILGVTAALEAITVLNETGAETLRAIEVVNWTAEEGARFSPAMLGSGAVAGIHDASFAYGRVDAEGVSFGTELERIGFRGDVRNRVTSIYASLEMHIEQGTQLEDAGVPIGIVRGIDPVRWFTVVAAGRGEHAGGPGPENRRDAAVAAARMIVAARDRSLVSRRFKTTVGIIEAHPGSTNVVPNEVSFSLDVRATSDEALDDATAAIREASESIATEEGVELHFDEIWRLPATDFDESVCSLLSDSARARGHGALELRGGIGHDSMYLAKITRAAMIFTPTVDGLSHCEAEDSPWEDILVATEVLIDALIALANQPE